MVEEPVREIIYAYSATEWVGYDDPYSIQKKVSQSIIIILLLSILSFLSKIKLYEMQREMTSNNNNKTINK